jgi:hypothetical protein
VTAYLCGTPASRLEPALRPLDRWGALRELDRDEPTSPTRDKRSLHLERLYCGQSAQAEPAVTSTLGQPVLPCG